MAGLDAVIEDIVTANRILSTEGVVDGYGHVSMRHPERPDRYLMSRARAPHAIEAADIMEFALDGTPIDARGRSPYLERYIHGALYEGRPDVNSVVHSHSLAVIPFGVAGETIRPMMHNCAMIGAEVPIWDVGDKFGDTNLLVVSMDMGRDLARTVGKGSTALMRGHGSVVAERSLRHAVTCSVLLQISANLQMAAARFDTVKFLTPGEVAKCQSMLGASQGVPGQGLDRGWEYYCLRAGMPYRPG
jgi:ribulose-5-phosphate 4-epimerase/fuculose-1-phosphate aldolase